MADGSEAFGAFVAARYSALVRTAFLLVGDRGSAEDLVQTALFTTFLHWGRLRAEAAAEAYTRTTLVRLAARRAARRASSEVVGVDAFDGVGAFDQAAGDADAAVAVDVRRALEALPWQQRAVLVLRYFDDLSEADTARALRCSVGTVKSRANRALVALRVGGLLTGLVADKEASDG